MFLPEFNKNNVLFDNYDQSNILNTEVFNEEPNNNQLNNIAQDDIEKLFDEDTDDEEYKLPSQTNEDAYNEEYRNDTGVSISSKLI